MNNECNLTLNAALQRIKNIGVDFKTLIDVGASDGRWSKNALRFWPALHLVLFEPNRVHQQALYSFAAFGPGMDRAHVLPRVCSRAEEPVVFDGDDPWGGRVLPTDDGSSRAAVKALSVDRAVLETGVPGPFAIKLDVHGHEFACLDGARETLKSTNLAIIEVYLHDIDGTGVKTFSAIVEFMVAAGFRPIDMFDFMTRPMDGTLWQFDMAFIPANHLTFSNIGYQ